MTAAAVVHGVDGFTAGLLAHGASVEVRHNIVTFEVTPVSGALAGQVVQTGVALDEVRSWPLTPPHWVHLPGTVTIHPTNAQASVHPDWLQHSRDIKDWARETDHVRAWLAHVRSILAGAI